MALGSSGMTEGFDSSSTQGYMLVTLNETAEAGSVITLTDAAGKELVSYTSAKSFNCVEISCQEISVGETYTLTVGDTTKEIQMKETIYSDRNGRFGL